MERWIWIACGIAGLILLAYAASLAIRECYREVIEEEAMCWYAEHDAAVDEKPWYVIAHENRKGSPR